jgi:hypothetical protein
MKLFPVDPGNPEIGRLGRIARQRDGEPAIRYTAYMLE